MAKFGVVLVSHSEYIAKGLKELVDEMNDGSVQVVAAGGADGGRIGTSAIKIQQAIESVEDCGHILIYADLGSSILSAETAMDLIDEDLAEKVQIVDAPIVEGALAGVVQGTISDDVADVIKASPLSRKTIRLSGPILNKRSAILKFGRKPYLASKT